MVSIQPVPPVQPFLMRPSLAASGRLLLFSDSPEYVRDHGTLYHDQVHRGCRVFLHHVNSTSTRAGIFIVWKNQGNVPVAVTARSSGAGWSSDPAAAGRSAIWAYLRNPGADTHTAPPGGWLRWGLPDLAPGQTFSGIYDFDLTAPLRMYTVMVPAGVNPDPDHLPLLPRDGVHARGTWPHADRHARIVWDSGTGPAAVTLCTPHSPTGRPQHPTQQPLDGEFELGFSGADRTLEMLPGNYGVQYRLELALDNSTAGQQRVMLVLNPLGGAFFTAAEFGGQAVAMPAPIADPTSAWFAWQQNLWPGEKRILPVRLVPPGGSALPVRLIWFVG